MNYRDVYIVGGLRTPFVKSMTNFSGIPSQELLTAPLTALAKKFGLTNKSVGDVAIGATIKNPLDWNLARECVIGAGFSGYTPGYGVQRACGSSLDASLQIALKIASHQMDTGIAGGIDTNSDVPIVLPRSFVYKALKMRSAKTFLDRLKDLIAFRFSDLKLKTPSIVEPRTGLSMGEHCEKMVKEWGVTREAQDELALASHQNAAKAYAEGFYDDLVIEFAGIKKDTIVRSDTSLDKLAKLKPAFDFTGKGTLTAGNSSPLTDGASAVLFACEEQLKLNNWTPLAKFVDAEVAAVDYVHGDGLLMAPTIAVSKLLLRNNLTLHDFDFYEIHEAFTGQVLCTLKAWESAEYCKRVLNRDEPMGKIDRAKLNVKGGSVAIGHPFAGTGTRIVASLAKTLNQSKKKRGLISICTAGGMGVAAIIEGV
ncbi:MAG: acetyl-CoA C-acetyltransferase [Gammaproteobacteria bacterium]|nr:acetyl-CoA C-acetyltransferase [Gammaproteobacteria bacterium]